MTKDEAMQQALEALKESIDVPCYGGHPKQEAAYQALQEALVQQPAQQEPVAWLSTDSIGERYLCFDKPLDNDSLQPLYSTLPQRTWVGLTDEEFESIEKATLNVHGIPKYFGTAIEAKLKEKNT